MTQKLSTLHGFGAPLRKKKAVCYTPRCCLQHEKAFLHCCNSFQDPYRMAASSIGAHLAIPHCEDLPEGLPCDARLIQACNANHTRYSVTYILLTEVSCDRLAESEHTVPAKIKLYRSF